MSRLTNTLKMDFLLQWRYGFYYAAIFVTLVWLGLLWPLSQEWTQKAVPLIIFTDLGIIGFYFVAGQILFEKMEKALNALVVTPLIFWEYLFSKLISLTTMAVMVSLILALATVGPGFNWLMLTIGVVLMSVLSMLVGIFAIAPYRSISTFILPSQFYIFLLGLPMFPFFGLVQSPLFSLTPNHGAMVFLRSAFSPASIDELIFGLISQIIWIILLAFLTRWRFEQYVVAQKGGGW